MKLIADEKIFAGGIIFTFEFHCKRIVTIHGPRRTKVLAGPMASIVAFRISPVLLALVALRACEQTALCRRLLTQAVFSFGEFPGMSLP